MVLSGIAVAFIIGAAPTATMLCASFILSQVEVGHQIEACVQNFAAGLILSAVAGELFPILLEDKTIPSIIGISVGFVVAMVIIYGLEHTIERIESMPDKSLLGFLQFSSGSTEVPVTPEDRGLFTLPEGLDEEMGLYEQVQQYDDEPVAQASIALTTPAHRRHIELHLAEVADTILTMEAQSNRLSSEVLSIAQKESIAESIDEGVHGIQYKLDHVRRLLMGSEAELDAATGGDIPTLGDGPQGWVTEERKQRIRKGVSGLKLMALHMQDHLHLLGDATISKAVLKEMHLHMLQMDRQISAFHEQVEGVGSRWDKPSPLQLSAAGMQPLQPLPLSLILPVVLDCMVDGFLMGVSSSISLKAGIVLSLANCLEMAFLGMAYSARLSKCTARTAAPLLHTVALYGPPFVMLLSAGLGALIGEAVQNSPAIFIGLVSFGAVALLFLVCNELLVEAKAAQGDEERWWISAMVFLGVYVVLVLDHLL